MIQPMYFAYFVKNDCFENWTVDDVNYFLDDTENSLDCVGTRNSFENLNFLDYFENWNSLAV